jgi:hypothetical protein
VAKRKCRYCGRWFVPDPRVGKRQKACSIACQKLRKRESNRLYRENNPECWEGHYEYVKQWKSGNSFCKKVLLPTCLAPDMTTTGKVFMADLIKAPIHLFL